MTHSSEGTTLTIGFTAEQVGAIDDWIARCDEPRPSREEAVRQLVTGRLGAEGPRTMIPKLVSGRDIV